MKLNLCLIFFGYISFRFIVAVLPSSEMPSGPEFIKDIKDMISVTRLFGFSAFGQEGDVIPITRNI